MKTKPVKVGKPTALVARADIERAVAGLFLAGNNDKAYTLCLVRFDGMPLGGWSEGPMADWVCKELVIK
jgi:hypothetical protein